MRTWIAAVNHVQSLDDTFKVFINAGYAYNNGYDYRVDASSRVNVINDAGDFTRSMVNEPFAIRNKYIQIGANKIFNTGAVKMIWWFLSIRIGMKHAGVPLRLLKVL